jgi:GT2 family glycosyltransferase
MSDSEGAGVEVTAIVITYNSAEHIVESIRALENALEHLEAEILIVDNASSDETVSKAERTLSRGRVIANPDNLGYARAVNVGLRHARGRLTLVMNDDAQLQPGAIDRLREVLDSSTGIALVGPRIVDSAGQPTHSARLYYPGPEEEWQRLRDLITKQSRKSDYPASEEPMPVHWLIAACVLGRTSVLREVGGFNEAFFLYGEDIDLGRRLSRLGFQSVTVPDAVCVHVGGVSTSKTYTADARTHRQISGRNVYYRLWLPRWLRTVVYLLRAFGLKGQPDRLRIFLRLAMWDGPSLRDQRFPPPLAASDGTPDLRADH